MALINPTNCDQLDDLITLILCIHNGGATP